MGGVPPTALARPAPGERTISNAEVPLPRSPLSLATGTAHRKACSIGFAPKRRLPAALGTCLAGTISAVGGSVQGCRGRSPRRNKLWGSPLPAGKGGRGMGERKQAKGKVSRRPTGQATLWAPPTPADPATCRTSHPLGTTVAGIASAAGANHPLGTAAAGIDGKQKGAPRGTQVPHGAPRAKKPGNLPNYLLSFLITRLS